METTRKIIRIDEDKCDGCGACILSCAEGAIVIENGKAKVLADMYCDGLGACLGSCHADALTIIERPAVPFNEEAVTDLLASQKQLSPPTRPGVVRAAFAHEKFAGCSGLAPLASEAHWPIKLRLIDPATPHLQKTNLILAADCSAFAAQHFHETFAKDAVLLSLCPKFEESKQLVQKLARIFATANLTSCTAIKMEVPCCNGVAGIVKDALAKSTTPLSCQLVTLSRTGAVLETMPHIQ